METGLDILRTMRSIAEGLLEKHEVRTSDEKIKLKDKIGWKIEVKNRELVVVIRSVKSSSGSQGGKDSFDCKKIDKKTFISQVAKEAIE